jgi:hypothetical protein
MQKVHDVAILFWIIKMLVPHIDVMDMRPYTGYSFDPDELSG